MKSVGTPVELNAFGYAVVLLTMLAVGLLLVGGWSYAGYAGGLLAATVVLVGWAMRRQKRRAQDREARSRERDEDRERREKEAEAEKTRYGGGV